MILLIQPVGIAGRESHAMGIVAELEIGVGLEIGAHALIQRVPVRAAVH